MKKIVVFSILLVVVLALVGGVFASVNAAAHNPSKSSKSDADYQSASNKAHKNLFVQDKTTGKMVQKGFGAGVASDTVAATGSGWTVTLVNNPLTDGIVTEDGVTGYQYIYDVSTTNTDSERFVGLVGFDGSKAAWVRTHPYYGVTGDWQFWQPLSAGHEPWYAWYGWVGIDDANSPSVNNAEPNVDGNWRLGVDQYGDFVTAGQTIPWGKLNAYHAVSDYTWAWEIYMPTTDYVPLNQGLSWDGIWAWSAFGLDPGLMMTIRVVHPNRPGTIQWKASMNVDGDPVYSGTVLGPSGTSCGDGIVQSQFGEQCDDGNNVNGDGCSATCQSETACQSVIASLMPGNAKLQAIDTACCVKKGASGLLTFDDPTSDEDTHGDYVSCVVLEAKNQGLTSKTNPSRGDVANTAAQSSVNMPANSNQAMASKAALAALSGGSLTGLAALVVSAVSLFFALAKRK